MCSVSSLVSLEFLLATVGASVAGSFSVFSISLLASLELLAVSDSLDSEKQIEMDKLILIFPSNYMFFSKSLVHPLIKIKQSGHK